MNKKVIFLSVQPDNQYFHWQIEVLIHNFLKVGINPNHIEILFGYYQTPSDEGLALAKKYPMVRFFFYKIRIIDNFGYIPIIRPDLLEQHFINYPELYKEVIFYHDSDIIFRKLPDFDNMHDDKNWYLSNTVSYIGSNYIKSKGDDLFINMCSLLNISPKLVEDNELNSGGAQYLMKGITSTFWKTCISDTLTLYKYLRDRETYERSILSKDELLKYNPIQKWCVDMWAVLWGAWKIGVNTVVSSELDFSWGTSDLHTYYRCNIMHNAGVTDTLKNTLFYKADYRTTSPFESDLSHVNKNSASYKYVEAINFAKSNKQLY